jgi:hypothetical protein
MSKPDTTETNPPIHPCELVGLWRGVAQEWGTSNPEGAKALLHCADELAKWIAWEGISVIMCMPPSYFRLIMAAHDYDADDKERMDDLQELIASACNVQNGHS